MENNYDKKYILKLLMKLIYIIDIKDSYTKNHAENVTKYALLLGNELKLEKKDLEIIEIGAMIHDIGKIGIPDYILTKKTSLTNNEFEIIKRHVIIGEAILPDTDEFKEIKKMVRSHHERIDGTGYPDGLKGSEISYFTRILSIADTFDTITTQLPYNKIKTLDEAFKELCTVSKKQLKYNNEITQQLDPYLVEIFIQGVKNNKELIEEFKKKDFEIINNRNQKNIKIINK